MRGFTSILSVAIAVAVSGTTGCITSETRTGSAIIPPRPDSPPPAFGTASQTSVSAIGVCSVPYDGFTLPVISPDGRWLATQVGVPPTWPTLLATKNQSAPLASAIEVWRLDAKGGRRIAAYRKGLILGRSADDIGCLVEEVLDDGSRRIGRIHWPTAESAQSMMGASLAADDPARVSEPEWMIDDGRVNAFACLAATGGSIAWCSRDVRESGFALSVRHGQQLDATDSSQLDPLAFTNWDLPPGPDQSWMLPVFSADGKTLFAMLLRDGITDLASGSAADAVAFRQSMVQRRLSVRMDAQRTYQTLAPQGTLAAVGHDGDTRLILFDPDLRRMAIWDPRDDTFRPLAAGTFAACLAPDGSALAADRDGLILDHPDGASGFPPRVYNRPAVPRFVGHQSAAETTHDWLLFVPNQGAERNVMNVVRFALLKASMAGE
jgi:hypothetical protein